MPFRYQFLANRFDPDFTPKQIAPSKHRDLDLKANIIDWERIVDKTITDKEEKENFEHNNKLNEVLSKEQLYKFKRVLRDELKLTNDQANLILEQKITQAKLFLENDKRYKDKNEHSKEIQKFLMIGLITK
ncbi:hypothetical protein NFD60_12775 (plasmid) [Staphylococcus epidermidis]|nr:hypothetical protein NFD60_12775 [Staphylococcus epidermidis]